MMASRSLADINSAVLGTRMPEITLPDGSVVQTGTVGALLVNIKAYNQAHSIGDQAEMQRLQALMAASWPLLKKVGMFDLFSPEEWSMTKNEGRKLVGRLAKEAGY